MALTIRAAIDDGASEFDMLWGTEPYKALWARERPRPAARRPVSLAISAAPCTGMPSRRVAVSAIWLGASCPSGHLEFPVGT